MPFTITIITANWQLSIAPECTQGDGKWENGAGAKREDRELGSGRKINIDSVNGSDITG
jgi:hypothetical protein